MHKLHSAFLSTAGLILLHSTPLLSQPSWTRASSPHLDLLTTAEVSLASRAVADLEGLRSFFRQSSPAELSSPASIRIVAFSSEKEFHDFRVNSFSPAYFAGGSGQAYIVLGRLSKESLPTLRHEFVHALLWQPQAALPLWLEEGLADYYGGLDPTQVRLRARRISREPLALESLLAVHHGSAEYREIGFARRFYAQSWALVHMLLNHPGYRGGAARFIELSRRGTSASDAFQEAFGAGLARVEADLRRYGRRLRSPLRSAPASLPVETTPADLTDVQLTLARIQTLIGQPAPAVASLAEANPGRPEAFVLLGDSARRSGDAITALLHYRRAFQLGSRDKVMLWHLAVLEQSSPDPSGVVAVLENLVQADPDNQDARLVLSSHYLSQHRDSEALELLLAVQSPPPARLDYYRRALELAQSRVIERTATLASN